MILFIPLGSVGVLCEGCDLEGKEWGTSYSYKSSHKGCVECDSIENQLIYIIAVFCLTIVYLLYGINIAVKNNIQQSKTYYLRMMGIAAISLSKSNSVSSSYIKIFTHFI